MKLLRTICVLAVALCFVTSAYAGTQSVKISGDLTMRSLFRGNYDLDQNHSETLPTAVNVAYPTLPGGRRLLNIPGSNDWESYFMSTAEVQIDADLTDNVSAVIRLLNQRDWNRRASWGDSNTYNAQSYEILEANGLLNDDEFNVNVDLAYVELKEFLYSPLTLKVGRQDIWLGRGFIVGKNRQNPGYGISAPEYTAIDSFDALRATLDYDPWTIDMFVSKVQEGNISSNDDVTLTGVNVGYIFDVYNAEGEAYWVWKNDANTIQPSQIDSHNTIHTFGARGSADPIENWTLAGEVAFQAGDYVGFINQQDDRSRAAWALDASAECRYFKEKYAWKPVIGMEYVFYSGDTNENTTIQTNGNYTGWDMMYRGKDDSRIREFFGRYYWSAQGLRSLTANAPNTLTNPEDSSTNQHQLIVMGTLQPTDSLTFDARYLAFWQAEERNYIMSNGVSQQRDHYVGSEVDLQLTWDYTEDVSFGLVTAWFFPGSVYGEGSESVATDVVGTMKLSF